MFLLNAGGSIGSHWFCMRRRWHGQKCRSTLCCCWVSLLHTSRVARSDSLQWLIWSGDKKHSDNCCVDRSAARSRPCQRSRVRFTVKASPWLAGGKKPLDVRRRQQEAFGLHQQRINIEQAAALLWSELCLLRQHLWRPEVNILLENKVKY